MHACVFCGVFERLVVFFDNLVVVVGILKRMPKGSVLKTESGGVLPRQSVASSVPACFLLQRGMFRAKYGARSEKEDQSYCPGWGWRACQR